MHQFGALFQYDWRYDRLRKISESATSTIALPYVLESYRPNEFLTGRAWVDAAYRHIIDYKHLQTNGHDLIEIESHRRHTAALGEIRTVLYAQSSLGDSGLLFRLMNRTDEPRSPFYLRHQRILHEVTGRLTDFVDDKRSKRRLHWVQHVAGRALIGISRPDAVLSDVRNALQEEFIEEFGVMVGSTHEEYIQMTYLALGELGEQRPTNLPSVQADTFLQEMLGGKDIPDDGRQRLKIVNLQRGELAIQSDHFLSVMKTRGAVAIAAWPLRSLEIRGVLFIPLNHLPGSAARFLSQMPASLRQFIEALVTIIENHASTMQSHVTSERAQRLIGQIGHEISSPVTHLASLALGTVALVRNAFEKMGRIDPELSQVSSEITRNEAALLSKAQEISLALHIASQMAQIGSGAIAATFEEYDLYSVMKTSSDEVVSYSRVVQEYARHRFTFEYNDACRRLPRMMGDPILMKKVFDNLFSNAIKYSYTRNLRRQDESNPRRRDGIGQRPAEEPIKIEIQANPVSGWTNIYVRNWGVGIPPDKTRMIFRPFERADTTDPRERRRGMGLGLYLTKIFLDVHNSQISCTSVPTLDDPKRTSAMSGYLTTFELKLRQGLTRGPVDFRVV